MDELRIHEALARVAASSAPTLEVVAPGGVRRMRRVGLLAGSFDPMTVAHAAVAEALRREGCDLVVLVYSASTLPKEEHAGREPAPPLLPPARRVASLVAFATPRDWVAVAVASHGLLVDQAEAAARLFPDAELVIGAGSDKLLQLLDAAWYQDRDAALERLFRIARVAYAVRAGDEETVARALEDEPRWRRRLSRLDAPDDLAEVSSRAVRSGGRAALDRVPPEVLEVVRAATPRPRRGEG